MVRDTLANNNSRPDEATKAQSKVKQKGRYTFIDKVKVRLIGNTYVAECVNFGSNSLRISDDDVHAFERLLTGGVWAQVEVECDERDSKAPFSISQLSGLVKIIHPHGEPSKEDLEEILKLAIECRRRVKEQLKKMGSFEYSQTSFSYSDNDTGEEHFVGVPEQGGQDLIAAEPMAPGSVYTASVTGDGTVGLYRLEVSIAAGNGKLKPAGGISGPMKESIQRAFAYLQANKSAFSISHEADSYDYNVEAIDLLGNKVEAEVGVAFFVAAFSAIRRAPARAGMLVMGDMSIQGNIKAARSLVEPLQVAMDNGPRCALIPGENKRSFLEINTDEIDKIDPIFYNDVKTATFKGLDLN